MYAVIRSQGKQFKVAQGDELDLPLLKGEAGEKVTFGEVLAVGGEDKLTVGRPTVNGASVSGTILRHGRDKKILTWKYLRRKNSAKRIGHRQHFTRVRIDEIKA